MEKNITMSLEEYQSLLNKIDTLEKEINTDAKLLREMKDIALSLNNTIKVIHMCHKQDDEYIYYDDIRHHRDLKIISDDKLTNYKLLIIEGIKNLIKYSWNIETYYRNRNLIQRIFNK